MSDQDQVEIPTYRGKPIADYDLWELGDIHKSLHEALEKREAASKHHKFDKINNKKALDFPPTNPEFLKLKDAIEAEIRKKQNA